MSCMYTVHFEDTKQNRNGFPYYQSHNAIKEAHKQKNEIKTSNLKVTLGSKELIYQASFIYRRYLQLTSAC